jgi:hypothetical protein
VRQVAYNSGSGNVPAIGTLVTQGGVTGYLLAVYASMSSAPTAVGAAMPATGFIKFREVTGGAFTAGALTGIGASATGADVVGWIEVVQEQAVANTVPRLGFYRTRGDWFELGETNGSAGQTFQVPTNGGGSGTHVPAVWIETAAGSGQYESYPALLAAAMIPANLGTDARSKFVQTVGDGVVRIGNNGTNNVGYVPPAGCKVRIPNVIGRQTTAANRALNQTPHATLATRPDFTTTAGGDIDIENFINDWYMLFASPYKVKVRNSATFDIHSTSNEAAPTELNNYCIGAYNGTSITLTLTSNPLGGTVTDCKFFRVGAASNGHAVSIITSSNYVFENCHSGIITFARSTGYAFVANQCRNFEINNHKQYNGDTRLSTCANIFINDIDHCDRFVGNTTSATGIYVVLANVSSDNIKVDGITFGLGGLIANTNPYAGLVYAQNSSNITFRNAGTRAAPLAVTSGFAPAYIFQDAGVNDGVLVQRMYVAATRTSLYVTVNTSKNITLESLHGTVGSLQTLSLNTLVKGVRAASNSVTAGASVYGTHVFDMFTADTTGVLWWAFNEPTAFSADFVTLTLAGATGGFTSGGQVSMPTVGDELIIEMPYFALGITALANTAPTLTGTLTGNFTYEYAIDTGAGFGAYQTLNAANLSAEVIDPAIGFKLRLRVTTATGNTTNALTYVRINTVSTLAAQTDNLYPLDLATITLTGYIVGTRVQIYNTTDDVEVFNDVLTGSFSLATPYTEEKIYRIRAMYVDGLTAVKFIEVLQNFTIEGFTVDLPQVVDEIYGANAVDGSTVTGVEIDDSALLVNVDTGVLSWQSLYAYETYWLQTEAGIRDEQRFITAVDQANYILEDFKIKNVSDPTAPLVLIGGYGKDSVTGEAVDIIDTTGGTIFSAPDRVVPFATGGGGAGGDTKEDIYTYFTSSGRQNTFKADVSDVADNADVTAILAAIAGVGGGSAPTAEAIADEIMTRDIATETNATANRVAVIAALPAAPDNAGITAIKAKTDNLPADPASNTQVNTRLATAGYTAPNNADITAIKAKTDQLVFTAGNLNAIAQVVADKTGYALTAGERTAIAVAVEQAILNEADGNAILEAIVGAIGNSNVDEIALVAAIRADIERAGGMLTAVPTLSEIEASTVLAKEATVNTRLATASYVAPDNAGIGTANTKLDTKPSLAQIEGSTVIAKEATVATKASQASVSAIPTNPLLTNDARLNNLDATISSRSTPAQVNTEVDTALADYDAPTNAELQTVRGDILAGLADLEVITADSADAILAELASVGAEVDVVSVIAVELQKYNRNRWRITGNQFTVYDNDGVTPLKVFNLRDADGNPTMTEPYERTPV